MSYNNESGKRDYRGRGKRASEHYRGKHFKPSASDDELVPIGNTAVEARMGQHERPAGQDAAGAARDPFAPSERYAPEPAGPEPQSPRAGSERASEPTPGAGSGPGREAALEQAPAPEPVPPSAPAAGPQTATGPTASAAAEKDRPPRPAGEPAAAASAPPAAGTPADDAARYRRGEERYTKHKAGFSRGQKIAVAVVAVVAAIVFAAAGAAFAFYQSTQSNIELSDQSIKDELTPTVSNEKPYWVLIMGSDSRTTDTSGTRSDVIMLARIDEPNKQVTLVSIPRDSYVQINGSPNKINAAYSLGGAKQMIQTVQDFTGVKISHYAEIYFSGFEDLVDDIGGVDVVVPETGSYHGVTIKKGKQHLNGKEALTFARIRKSYATGDFRRTECQRILVQALAKKILSQDVTEIPNTITSASKCFSTDMELSEVISIATYMKGMDTDSMYSAMAPSTTGMIGGVSYTFTYNYQWILMMDKANTGENPKLTKTETSICGTTNTQYTELDMEAGLPQTVQTQLQAYWDKQEAKKKAKQEEELAVQGSSSESSSAN